MYLIWAGLVYQCFESVMQTIDKNALKNAISKFIIQLACILSLKKYFFKKIKPFEGHKTFLLHIQSMQFNS